MTARRQSAPAFTLRRIAALLSVLLLYQTSTAVAQDGPEKKQELRELREQIQILQEQLEANQKKKSKAEKRLREVESQIGESSRELRRIDRELDKIQRQIKSLRAEQRSQAGKLRRQRERLASEARRAYAMGHQQQVKLLLNQEQPAAVGRMLMYFGYFSRARRDQIEAMRNNLGQLRALEDSIARESESLTLLRDRQQRESERLQKKKDARKQAITALARELQNQGGKLRRLRADEQQLQELVASLQELLADIPAETAQQQPFNTLKGKLRWPTRGRLAESFGSRRGSTGLKWRGVVIEAAAGGDVRAVSQGRVAFSDWMRGFGLLVILDHGDGYMSLYGHNQTLYKEVGEWVDTGEVVAQMGASGGQTKSGLYFELRHNGQPINPLSWCAGKPAA